MKRNKNSTSSSKNSTPSNGFKKDFSVKLPSSTPVASPRYGANPEKNSKEAKQKLVGNSGMTPSSSNLSTKAKSASAECPVPKPRKIVSNTTDDPSKDAEISETNQEVSSSGSYSLASDVSSTVEVRQPVIQEGSNLYLRFLSEEIHANQLEVPSFLRVPESAYRYSYAIRDCIQRLLFELLQWELTINEFSNSSHRLRVRDHAESVQLENLSIDGFFELLDGLFKEGGITYERVLVLFFFCTDITVRALRDNLVNYVNDLVSWTLKFFSENIFFWVQQNGGWACVLQKSMDFTYKALLVTTLCFSTLALISYLRKK